MTPLVESEVLELKSKFGKSEDIGEAACAFANTRGGTIYGGVADDGMIIGIEERGSDEAQRSVSESIHAMQPYAPHEIRVEVIEGRKVILVKVDRLPDKTLCSYKGRVFIRSGTVNRRSERKALQDLLASRSIVHCDEMPSPAVIADVSSRMLSDYLRSRSPGFEFNTLKTADYLRSLQVVADEERIRNAGVIFFTEEPRRYLPQLEVRLVRFKGGGRSEFIDTMIVSSSVPRCIDECLAFIRRNIQVSYPIEDVQRREVFEYPWVVLREAVINMVAHRDYCDRNSSQINIHDNRIEFINPGDLPRGLSLSELGGYAVHRNLLLYDLMRGGGLIEGMGTGIPRMRSEMIRAGLPEPNFEVLEDAFFRVTLFNRMGEAQKQVGPRGNLILQEMKRGPVRSSELARLLKVSQTQVVDDLNQLVELKMAEKFGRGRGVRYRTIQ
ncbi:MAG: RNA-binding domain-containing protein [Methanomassiliicoccales archaeon]